MIVTKLTPFVKVKDDKDWVDILPKDFIFYY